ncbi:hypothetical protein EFL99_09890 [Lactococcus lactis]|uniref:hypothetical protein n=1 Tax=Lactococcus lactis TaxID=1358 RepID=UPI00223AEB2F|nr:hypothetical protein [Lactococcus lactis]MCT1183543.1 hypothetical protein [Lactococcus lactis]
MYIYEMRFEVKLFDVNGSYMSDSEYDANIFNALLAVHQDIQLFLSGFYNYSLNRKEEKYQQFTKAEIELEIILSDKETLVLREESNAYIALSKVISRAYQCLIDNDLE